MERNGYGMTDADLFDFYTVPDIIEQINICSTSKEIRDTTHEQTNFLEDFSTLGRMLFSSKENFTAQECLEIEGAFITFEKDNYARTPEEEEECDKKIDKLVAAERTLALVQNAAEYRAEFERKISRFGVSPDHLPSEPYQYPA